MTNRPRLHFFLAVSALLATPALRAASVTWDGGSLVDSNWSSAANWTADTGPSNPTLPAPPDIVTLAGTVRLNPNVDTAWAVDTLNINSGSGAFTLSGQTITFQPSNGTTHDNRFFLVNGASTTQTINNNLVVTSSLAGATKGSGISVGTGNLILNGNLDIGTISGLRFQGGTGTVTINGVISGAPTGTVAVNGGTTVVLNGVNTFTNSFTIWNGVAKVGADSLNNTSGALGNSNTDVTLGFATSVGAKLLTSAAVTIGRNIVLVRNTGNIAYTIGGDTAQVSNYTGVIRNGADAGDSNAAIVTSVTGGRVNINSITRRANATSGSAGFDSVTKTGAGIVAFTGTSDYSGVTTVSAGTLLANGTLSSTAANSSSVGAVTVAPTAALGGTGTINRAVSIQNGASLAPGDISVAGLDQAGKLTLGAGLNLASLSTLRFDLDTAASTADDEISVLGNLTLDGTLNITNLGGFGLGSYKLFSYTGSLVDNTLSIGSAPVGYSYSIDTTVPNTVSLTVTPEPGVASLLILASGLVASHRRRRKSPTAAS